MTENHWSEDRLTGRWAIFANAPNHGWIEWQGGPPPFATGDADVRLRSGRLILYRGVVGIGGRKNPGGNWVHLGEMSDIVAYRLHPRPVYTGDSEDIIPF